MRKIAIVSIPILLGFAIGFAVGHRIGSNDEAASELNDALTLHIATYKAARAGNTNRAALYMVMGLKTSLEKYSSANANWLFRLLSGRKLANSQRTQKNLTNAQAICALEKTNFVVIGPNNAVKVLSE